LEKNRSYFIVGAFVLGMLLTPPDVVSQILLAIPLLALFECGIWLGKRSTRGDSCVATK
jgi:sec-independent protein translocase protein TatC